MLAPGAPQTSKIKNKNNVFILIYWTACVTGKAKREYMRESIFIYTVYKLNIDCGSMMFPNYLMTVLLSSTGSLEAGSASNQGFKRRCHI